MKSYAIDAECPFCGGEFVPENPGCHNRFESKATARYVSCSKRYIVKVELCEFKLASA